MERDETLDVARSILEQPTAPFHEEAVRDAIIAQLCNCRGVTIEHDGFGNMIVRYNGNEQAGTPWALAAHMDHPAWVRTREGGMRFLGSVHERYLHDPKTRDFGAFAMWDLPAFELRDEHIHSRACDDLVGCAVIVCLFRELSRSNAAVNCIGIFSRAEEVGFWGAIHLAQSLLIPRDMTIFSLETSTPRGGARIGSGPIVRVGDRLSIFDSRETARLLNVARATEIPVQRCLLDGGACEASAYQLYGYTAIAASIGLGNYHNCAADGSIQPEFVAIDDYLNMVRLCHALTIAKAAPDPLVALRDQLETRAAEASSFYRELA